MKTLTYLLFLLTPALVFAQDKTTVSDKITVSGKVTLPGVKMVAIYEIKDKYAFNTAYAQLQRDWQAFSREATKYRKSRRYSPETEEKVKAFGKEWQRSRTTFLAVTAKGTTKQLAEKDGVFEFEATKGSTLYFLAPPTVWIESVTPSLELSNFNKKQDYTLPPDVENIRYFL